MWKIHGKIYDLSLFLDKHPGGRTILEVCKGGEDLTATFESYHALSNMDKIKKIMTKYEIGECEPSNFTFKEGDFYRTIQKRVKTLFENKSYKSNQWWLYKSLSQAFLFFTTFILSFYYHSLGIYYRIFLGLISGHMIVQFGFGVMHDASHNAISNKSNINSLLSNIWNSLAFWDGQLWCKHHVFKHHTFTGDKDNDPDIIHFKPFIRKSEEEDKTKYIELSNKYPKIVALFTTCIFPGMFMGQGYLYNFVWLKRGYLWKMKLSSLYQYSILELAIKSFVLFSFLYGRNLCVFIAYAMGANITYFACIMPDHDTYETHENRVDAKKTQDWGEMQVRHSGNFSTQNAWVCDMFGGINYQIEHHLFPTMCHVHFNKIKPLVEQTCLEFNIPYVHHNSIIDAVKSTLKNYSKINESK
tara:strand:+ start:4879 stop:6120 length:1242 start_codon:yes stop_codon:yes gene_type:complete